jgi:lysyl-tRNA synthetase class 1
VLWGFIKRYAPDATPATAPFLDALVGFAVHYYEDFVEPTQRYRRPDAMEAEALRDLARELAALPAGADAEALQSAAYEVGKRHPFENLRSWFQTVYETLLGQSRGPRLGSFIALYGRDETVALIRRVVAGEAPGPPPPS